jgi:hypothetical protein
MGLYGIGSLPSVSRRRIREDGDSRGNVRSHRDDPRRSPSPSTADPLQPANPLRLRLPQLPQPLPQLRSNRRRRTRELVVQHIRQPPNRRRQPRPQLNRPRHHPQLLVHPSPNTAAYIRRRKWNNSQRRRPVPLPTPRIPAVRGVRSPTPRAPRVLMRQPIVPRPALRAPTPSDVPLPRRALRMRCRTTHATQRNAIPHRQQKAPAVCPLVLSTNPRLRGPTRPFQGVPLPCSTPTLARPNGPPPRPTPSADPHP